MNLKRLLLFVSFIVTLANIALLPHQAHAQDATSPAPTANSQPTPFSYDAQSYSNAPFDLALSKLTPAYKGIDPALLCVNLGKNFPKKSEFETTAEYNDRVQTAKTSPIFSNVTPQSLMAFQIEPDVVSATYDADKQRMQIKFDSWRLFTKLTNLGAYEAKNGFGATFMVAKGDTFHIFLDMKNDKNFGIQRVTDPNTYFVSNVLSCPMDVHTAMRVKPDIGVLVVCQMSEQKEQAGAPYLLAQEFTDEPTMQLPHDGSTINISIQSLFKEVLIYDFATGEILSTIKP